MRTKLHFEYESKAAVEIILTDFPTEFVKGGEVMFGDLIEEFATSIKIEVEAGGFSEENGATINQELLVGVYDLLMGAIFTVKEVTKDKVIKLIYSDIANQEINEINRFYIKEDVEGLKDDVMASTTLQCGKDIPGICAIDMLHTKNIAPIITIGACSDSSSVLKYFTDVFDKIQEFEESCPIDEVFGQRIVTMDDVYKILDGLGIIAIDEPRAEEKKEGCYYRELK